MLIDSARAFQTEGQVFPRWLHMCVCVCVCASASVCVLCTCWMLKWRVLTEQPLLPVCLPQVWHWYSLSASSQRDEYCTQKKYKTINRGPGTRGSFSVGEGKGIENRNKGSCTVLNATTGCIKQRMLGQLNHLSSVARRRWGWMGEINDGIHP